MHTYMPHSLTILELWKDRRAFSVFLCDILRTVVERFTFRTVEHLKHNSISLRFISFRHSKSLFSALPAAPVCFLPTCVLHTHCVVLPVLLFTGCYLPLLPLPTIYHRFTGFRFLIAPAATPYHRLPAVPVPLVRYVLVRYHCTVYCCHLRSLHHRYRTAFMPFLLPVLHAASTAGCLPRCRHCHRTCLPAGSLYLPACTAHTGSYRHLGLSPAAFRRATHRRTLWIFTHALLRLPFASFTPAAARIPHACAITVTTAAVTCVHFYYFTLPACCRQFG